MSRGLLLAILSVIFLVNLSFAGNNYLKFPAGVPPEMVKKQLDAMDKNKFDAGVLPGEQPENAKTADSSALSDSSNEKQNTDVYYSKMMKNELINPDSTAKSIELFGYKEFKSSKLNMSRNQTVSNIPASYTIAAGDVINILLWGRINEEHTLTVSGKGYINVPRIGPIYVSGLTFRGMRKVVEKKVSSIKGVSVTVTMGKLSDVKISVVGEVNNPGLYALPALSNVVDAIISSGGVSKIASLRNVEIRRNGVLRKRIDLYKYLLYGNNFGDIRFHTGDVVFVPVAKNLVTVSGNVRKSGVFELTGKSNLVELLSLCGGFTPAADKRRVQVERYSDGSKIVIDVDLTEVNGQKLKLNDGDWVKVFPVTKLYDRAVFLAGSVKRPGRYEFRDGMHISNIIGSYDDLTFDTYLKYAIVKRKDSTGTSSGIVSFCLGDAISQAGTRDNVLLFPGDSIVVFKKSYFEPEHMVYIGGKVTSPGKFPLADNMSIKDLILMAGGLRNEASSIRGELYRKTYMDDSVSTIKIDFSVSEAMKNSSSEHFKLKKFDAVYIRPKLGWQKAKHVVLFGEFNYPGEYIALEDETLDELVQRAGGIRGEADLNASIFVRNSVKELERKRTNEYVSELQKNILTLTADMTAKGNITPELLSVVELQRSALEKLKELKPVGRVVLDLEKDFGKGFKLEDGDTLYLPKKTNLVSVMGEVFNPATFRLIDSRSSISDYIERSGGYRASSDKRNCYVIKANGSVVTNKMVNLRRYSLESGDAIVVPKKVPYNNGRFKIFMNTLEVITRLSTITANTVSTVALIKTIK